MKSAHLHLILNHLPVLRRQTACIASTRVGDLGKVHAATPARHLAHGRTCRLTRRYIAPARPPEELVETLGPGLRPERSLVELMRGPSALGRR